MKPITQLIKPYQPTAEQERREWTGEQAPHRPEVSKGEPKGRTFGRRPNEVLTHQAYK